MYEIIPLPKANTNGLEERVSCSSWFASRPYIYTPNSLLAHAGVQAIMLSAMESGARLARVPHVTEISARDALKASSTLSNYGVNLLQIINDTRRAASERKADVTAKIVSCKPFGVRTNGKDTAHIGFTFDDDSEGYLREDATELIKNLGGRPDSYRNPDDFHFALLKTTRTGADDLAEKFTDIIENNDLLVKFGHIIVEASVARNVPRNLAEKWHAHIIED